MVVWSILYIYWEYCFDCKFGTGHICGFLDHVGDCLVVDVLSQGPHMKSMGDAKFSIDFVNAKGIRFFQFGIQFYLFLKEP